mmetsp:Transcript_4217/g.8091  ORF Transcript_4217/g.8091 Transcript_4217/m.8091 type:complete len:515 (-) Transcript_4217:98-1642(-)|eukprot:CAMPEP_0175135992 /NCGR_PEP_ID=MMETSP0087-20121206/9032_1 /TAXON_ID=136419 /ORGANISM="Unknown Unknown, Strain D1" /LENGTH=514 /DNA_ID=CAMNT_0016418707 /DNA_START=28 /DNA_END=1572 /DNA_ORIENTATION=+
MEHQGVEVGHGHGDHHEAEPDFSTPFVESPKEVWNRPGHRAVGWAELFYDLLYVAAAVKLATILKSTRTAESVFTFIVYAITFWQSWTNYTVYHNRYTGRSWLHEILFCCHAITVLQMLMTIVPADANDLHSTGLREGMAQQFMKYVGLNRLTLIFSYLWVAVKIKKERVLGAMYCIVWFIFGTLCMVSLAISEDDKKVQRWSKAVLLVIVFVDNLEIVALHFGRFKPNHPLFTGYHIHHLTERAGLLMMILLGETIMSITGLEPPDPRDQTNVGKSQSQRSSDDMKFHVAMAFAYAGAYWMRSYYFSVTEVGDYHALHRPTKLPWFVWMFAHVIMGTALVSMGVGWYLNTKMAAEGKIKLDYIRCLTWSVGFCNLAILLMRMAHFFNRDQGLLGKKVLHVCWMAHATLWAIVMPFMYSEIFYAAKTEPVVCAVVVALHQMSIAMIDSTLCSIWIRQMKEVSASNPHPNPGASQVELAEIKAEAPGESVPLNKGSPDTAEKQEDRTPLPNAVEN